MTSQLVTTLRARGLTVALFGDRLMVTPRNLLTDELRDLILGRRDLLVAELRREVEAEAGHLATTIRQVMEAGALPLVPVPWRHVLRCATCGPVPWAGGGEAMACPWCMTGITAPGVGQ